MTEKVAFEPHPKQLQFINAVLSGQYRYLLFGGAAGGGKSYVGLAVLILLAKFYPGSRSFVIRESLPTLKRTTIPTFLKLCPRSFVKSYNQTEQMVTFRNGSTLTFFPENYVQDKNLTRFDGLEANFFLIEEGQECQQKTFEKCKLRVGRHIIPDRDVQPQPTIMITCNPSQNWTKNVFHEPAKNGTLPPDHYYLQSLMVDNPSLPESYLAGLINLDEVTRAVFVDGDWDVTDVDKPFAYAFKKEKHVKKNVPDNPNEPIVLSFDFNVDPITCLAAQHHGNTIRILKEFRLKNSDIYELCQHISSTYGNRPMLVTGDASGSNRSAMTQGALNYYQIIKRELNLPKHAFKIPSFNPSIRNSRILLNSILEKHPNFEISENCPWLVNDLKNVEVDENGDILKDRKNQNRESDLLDCLRYYLWTFHHGFIRLN